MPGNNTLYNDEATYIYDDETLTAKGPGSDVRLLQQRSEPSRRGSRRAYLESNTERHTRARVDDPNS